MEGVFEEGLVILGGWEEAFDTNDLSQQGDPRLHDNRSSLNGNSTLSHPPSYLPPPHSNTSQPSYVQQHPSSSPSNGNNSNNYYSNSDSLIPSPVSNDSEKNNDQDNDDSNDLSNSTNNSQSLSKSDIFLLNSPTSKTSIKKKIKSRRNKKDRVGNRYHYPALCQKTFKAQCTYMPKNNKKVPIHYGDIIKIYEIYEDGWAYGRVESITNHSFREGLFPVIEMLEQGGLKEIHPSEAVHGPPRDHYGPVTEEDGPNASSHPPSMTNPSSKTPSMKMNSSRIMTNNTTNGIGLHAKKDRIDPPVISSHAYPPQYQGPVKQNAYVLHSSSSVSHLKNPSYGGQSMGMTNASSPRQKKRMEEDREEDITSQSDVPSVHSSHHSHQSHHSHHSHASNATPTYPNYSGSFVKQSGSYAMKPPYSTTTSSSSALVPPPSTLPMSPTLSAHHRVPSPSPSQQPPPLSPRSPNLSPQRQHQLQKINSDIRDIRAMLRRGGIDTGTRKALQERLDQLELDKKRNYPPLHHPLQKQ